ncbi:MAG: phosphate ABC transporter substrate-binding protein PstS family protein [bacterium]|nr:phosphate ABC transporter substrate-binding protein PstS family protein [bacterium]
MRRKITKLAAIVLAGSMAMAGLVGCGSKESTQETTNTEAAAGADAAESTQAAESTSDTQATEAEPETQSVSGSVSLAGSTSMEKVCEALMEGFMEKYPDVTVTTEYTGSGAGLESLNAGSVDIGNASRHIKDEEAASGAVENVIALDGIAVIAHKDNTVTDITSEQLAKIYTGEITNWSELGGADAAIVVIGREAGSGTRDAFEELNEIKDNCKYAQELDSTGAVLAKVASNPEAIGYVSLDVVDDTVIAEKLNGVEASEENILNGTYALQRPFVMATKGEVSEQNAVVQTWFDYIKSGEGQEIIQSVGLIIPN